MRKEKGEMKMKKKVVSILEIVILCFSLFFFAGTALASSVSLSFKVSLSQDIKAAPLSVWPSAWFYYSPSEIQLAYNLNPLYEAGYNGSGQTIVIVDAYGSPHTYYDLQVFDSIFGIPDPPSFEIYYPTGIPSPDWENDPVAVGWAIETSLDVQWAHAIAPGANIALVVSNDSYIDTMTMALQWAVDNEIGSVISQSFGLSEYWYIQYPEAMEILEQDHAIYRQAARQGISVLASSGDNGINNEPDLCFPTVSYPASDPYVTAVGGTSLYMELDENSVGTAYSYETVWEEALLYGDPSDPYLWYAGTGGGISDIFRAPWWQRFARIKVTELSGDSYTPKMRSIPDVSYNAGVYTSPIICIATVPYPDWSTWIFWIGGTSAGSPQWAGIIAIANQISTKYLHRTVGFTNPKLYTLSLSKKAYSHCFHDVTLDDPDFPYGNSGFCWADPSTYPLYYNATFIPGYAVTDGWDACTGLGTPNAVYLVPALAWLSCIPPLK